MRTANALRIEPHDRRLQPRHTIPIGIVLSGESVSCNNWSLSGFSALGFTRKLSRGQTVTGTIDAGRIRGEFAAKVVRIEDDGEIGVQFIEIDPAVYGGLLVLARG